MSEGSPSTQIISGGLQFDCVAQNLRRAARLVTRRYEEALRPARLTTSQFTILTALNGAPQLPQGKMAAILGFEQTTLTRLLKPLARRGLVEIRPDPDDGRGRLVALSKGGSAALAQARPLWEAVQANNLARLSAGEWPALRTTLTKLSE
jgi:DNA-binding MarR family transcriptional regulator